MIRLYRDKMIAPFTNGSVNQRKLGSYTLTGLKRWSCHSRELPRRPDFLSLGPVVSFTKADLAIDQVKALHVYDFDNTCKSFWPRRIHLQSGTYLTYLTQYS